jgi:hypothetical protein
MLTGRRSAFSSRVADIALGEDGGPIVLFQAGRQAPYRMWNDDQRRNPTLTFAKRLVCEPSGR